MTKKKTGKPIDPWMLQAKITHSRYAVPVPKKRFAQLLAYESARPMAKHLWESLEKIGPVQCVEYDGHFGSYIYFDVFANAKPNTLPRIFRAIAKHLNKAGANESGKTHDSVFPG
jgi:hypothetical protein